MVVKIKKSSRNSKGPVLESNEAVCAEEESLSATGVANTKRQYKVQESGLCAEMQKNEQMSEWRDGRSPSRTGVAGELDAPGLESAPRATAVVLENKSTAEGMRTIGA